MEFIIKANDMLCDAMPKTKATKSFGLKVTGTLVATQVCDATVAPQNIRYPQDTSLLNEARVKLECMIDWLCNEYSLEKPRTYRKVAHKAFLSFAKSKKPSQDKIRLAVKAQLGYVNRDLKTIDILPLFRMLFFTDIPSFAVLKLFSLLVLCFIFPGL